MIVLEVLSEHNTDERVDILGITKDDLYIIERSLKNMIKTSNEFNPSRVQQLIRGLNDGVSFINVNDNNIPMYAKHEEEKEELIMIDLGLPSGTLWADRNLGANSPEKSGDYFRFGETTPFTKKSPSYEYEDIKGDIAGTEKDAATVILGKEYQTPTLEQIMELVNQCSYEWIKVNRVNGVKVTGPNGNSIFMPVAGMLSKENGLRCVGGIVGYCWSASANKDYYGRYMSFSSSGLGFYMNANRAEGFPIRAVVSKIIK